MAVHAVGWQSDVPGQCGVLTCLPRVMFGLGVGRRHSAVSHCGAGAMRWCRWGFNPFDESCCVWRETAGAYEVHCGPSVEAEQGCAWW